MEMSHMLLWFLAAWWQPVLGPVLSDSHWSCLGAAFLFSPAWLAQLSLSASMMITG